MQEFGTNPPEIPAKLKSGNLLASDFITFQAFSSAVITEERMRDKAKQLLAESLKNGDGQRVFAQKLNELYDKAGLTQLQPYQVETIYNTNTSLAYAASQSAKMIEHSDVFPYWQYRAVMDGATRPEHAALNLKVFSTSDMRYYPPISFNCRCRAIPITKNEAIALGADVSTSDAMDKLNIADANFLGNKQKNFLSWVRSNYPTHPTTKKLMEEMIKRIRVSTNADKKDLPKNKEVADLLAQNGYAVEIREHSFVQGVKNPEFTINGELADFKKVSNIKNVGNAIKSANKQGCTTVVIEIATNENINELWRIINGSLNQLNKNIKKVVVIQGKNIYERYRGNLL